jgi:5-methylcytosine-specific restriction endonuclease McrA
MQVGDEVEARLQRKREYNRKWQAENAEKLREYHRIYRAENAEKRREYGRTWRAVNAEKLREWRAENAEKIRERSRKYKAENTEKIRKYRAENAEKIRERKRIYHVKNIEKHRSRRALRRARQRNATVERVNYELIWKRDKGMCQICLKKVRRKADVHYDHVVPLSKGGEHSYRNVVVAHARCNLQKHNKAVVQQMRLLGV